MKQPPPRRARPASRPGSRPTSGLALHGAVDPTPGHERLVTVLAYVVTAALAVALLIMILGPHTVGDYMAETDFYGAYEEGARLVQQGRLVPARYTVIGPGYEILLGILGLVVRDLFLAAELLSLIATIAVMLLWFHLLRARAEALLGLFALLFMATNGHFYRHGYGALTDAPAIALQAGTLYLLLARRGDRALLAAGLLAGLAFLTRYNSVVLLPAGLLAILAGGTLAERRARAALLFAAGFLAPVAPWVLYSLARGGSFSFQLHHNIAYEVFARARGIPWDDYQRDLQPQFKSLWDVIARDPGAVASRIVFNVWDHLKRDALQLLGWPVALCALIGALFFDPRWKALWPLGVTAVLLFLTLIPVFYSERYSLALLPYYATLAAAAFATPRFALALGKQRRVWLKPALAVLPLVAAVQANVKIQARVLDQLPVEVLECAESLRSLRQPGDKVIARKWHIAYHGGVLPVGFPFTRTLPELADYARRGGVRWLYISWPEIETRPHYAYLLDTSAVVPGLTVHRVTRPHPAVLYEIGPEFGTPPAWMSNDTLLAWHNTQAQLLVEGSHPQLLYKLGSIAFAMRRYPLAREALEAAMLRSPRDIDIMVLLGNVLILTQDSAAARSVFRRLLAIEPDNVTARTGLGWASVIDGDFKRAGEEWKPVISSTRNPNTLQRMVALYRAIGDPEGEALAIATLARVQ